MRRLLLPTVSRKALAVTLRNWLAWRKQFHTNIILFLGDPVMYLGAIGWGLGGFVNLNGTSLLEYIAPGLLVMTAATSVVYDITSGGYMRLREQGVYQAMMNTSIREEEIIAGELIWEIVRSIMYGGMFLLVTVLFGLMPAWSVIMLPAILAINGMFFGSITWTVVAKIRHVEQLFYYFTLVVTPLLLFSGVFFPVDKLPGIAQMIIQVLPMYHIVEMSRDVFFGELGVSTLHHAIWAIGGTAVALLFPVRELRRALRE
ncbi:ABC transporter permease [Thermaerobacter subterraneus]|uniref:Transport permease protein n=1 Tax=Thermaerobacter subterraneus DSM 13965 TaxID=867903 RepID=K6QF66_9FIRM|nr:ABC transporter permease [Thermaerobacter subterraneus]EKP95596.1 ABC-type polysaccharide/polyol phosphate export system, permease component [Thermaerobacter subterraneus DSM 13965]